MRNHTLQVENSNKEFLGNTKMVMKIPKTHPLVTIKCSAEMLQLSESHHKPQGKMLSLG